MATKIKLKQLDDEILDLLGGGGSLIREITSNVAVGAAASGTLFPKGQTLTEFAEALLRKDITPTISTSFSGAGVKEVGSTVNGSTMTLNITNPSAVTVPINKVDFYEGSTLLSSQAFVAGKNSYSLAYNKQIKSNTQLKVVLTYSGNRTAQGTGDFTFVYGSFYGPVSAASVNDSTATGLLSSLTKSIKTTKGLTWNNVTLNDQRFCYMYPTSLGALSAIKDGNGFSQIEGYTRFQVNVTYPTDGKTVAYYVYLLTDSTTGSGFTQIYS